MIDTGNDRGDTTPPAVNTTSSSFAPAGASTGTVTSKAVLDTTTNGADTTVDPADPARIRTPVTDVRFVPDTDNNDPAAVAVDGTPTTTSAPPGATAV